MRLVPKLAGDRLSQRHRALDKERRAERAQPILANAISVGIRIIGSNEFWKPKFHPIPLKRWADATKMFGLVNVIVELQITQANHIEEMHDTIVPDVVKAQIEKRDAPKQIEKKKE